MSRVGKYPVTVPSGVQVTIGGGEVAVQGKLGRSTYQLADMVEASLEGDKLWVKPKDDSNRARVMWGTTRALLANMVHGCDQGFTVNLEINGVGYRAAVQGKILALQLGYSHDINFPIPEDVSIKCEKPTAIAITGRDRQRVGQIAAEIRAYRGPEPYKGKGIKYETETILRKEGKKK